MLSCREVTHLVATDALATAGWRRRMAVRLHKAMCRHCRRNARQLRALGEAVRAIQAQDAAVEVPARVRDAINAAAPPPRG